MQMANSARVAKIRKDAAIGNLEAAQIIASDTSKYGGLMLEWAQTILERAAEIRRAA
jgi:hypothetical protein